jgi:hypothetical protein
MGGQLQRGISGQLDSGIDGQHGPEYAKRIVGDDDPILKRFGMAIVILMNLSSDIQKELDRGIPVDPEGI